MKKSFFLFCSLLTLALACKKDKQAPPEEPKPAAELTQSLNTKVTAIDSLSKFAAHLKDLVVTDVDAAAGVTVFAPVNNAFTNAGGRRAPENQELLREKLADSSELEDYIIKGKLAAADLTDGKILKTINGKTLTVTVQNGRIYLGAAPLSGTGIASGAHYIMHSLSALLNQDKLPAITGLSDKKTFPGWLFTIEGRNFSTTASENEVKFNGIKAVVHTATADKLLVTVPQNASAGKVTVTIKGRTVSSEAPVAIMQANVSTVDALLSLECGPVQALAIDQNDNFFFSDFLNDRAVRYGSGGQIAVIQPLIQATTDVNGDGIINHMDMVSLLTHPWGIAVDVQNNVFVSTQKPGTGAIYKINLTQATGELWAGGNDFGPIGGPRNMVNVESSVLKFSPKGQLHFVRDMGEGDILMRMYMENDGFVNNVFNASAFRSADPTVTENQEITGLTFDSNDNIYIADHANARIWKVGADGIRSIAGNNNREAEDGTGAEAQFGDPFDVAIDKKGNLYVCDNDYEHQTFLIRMINPQGVVTTIAGGKGSGNTDGAGGSARFEGVNTIAVDSKGVLYIGTDSGRIRKLTIQ